MLFLWFFHLSFFAILVQHLQLSEGLHSFGTGLREVLGQAAELLFNWIGRRGARELQVLGSAKAGHSHAGALLCSCAGCCRGGVVLLLSTGPLPPRFLMLVDPDEDERWDVQEELRPPPVSAAPRGMARTHTPADEFAANVAHEQRGGDAVCVWGALHHCAMWPGFCVVTWCM